MFEFFTFRRRFSSDVIEKCIEQTKIVRTLVGRDASGGRRGGGRQKTGESENSPFMGLHEKEFEIRVERVGHPPTPTSARSRPNAFDDKRLTMSISRQQGRSILII
jgi:hypothetical protein